MESGRRSDWSEDTNNQSLRQFLMQQVNLTSEQVREVRMAHIQYRTKSHEVGSERDVLKELDFIDEHGEMSCADVLASRAALLTLYLDQVVEDETEEDVDWCKQASRDLKDYVSLLADACKNSALGDQKTKELEKLSKTVGGIFSSHSDCHQETFSVAELAEIDKGMVTAREEAVFDAMLGGRVYGADRKFERGVKMYHFAKRNSEDGYGDSVAEIQDDQEVFRRLDKAVEEMEKVTQNLEKRPDALEFLNEQEYARLHQDALKLNNFAKGYHDAFTSDSKDTSVFDDDLLKGWKKRIEDFKELARGIAETSERTPKQVQAAGEVLIEKKKEDGAARQELIENTINVNQDLISFLGKGRGTREAR